MKHFKVVQSKAELNSTGGNYVCGILVDRYISPAIPTNFQSRRRGSCSDQEILLAAVGLHCNGRSDFNDIDLYRKDPVFMNAYKLNAVPSEATFRQRLDELPPERTHEALRKANVNLLSGRTLGRVDVNGRKLVPVDIDVSVLNNSGSSKQGVSFTYKGCNGYAPIMAYIGSEGYMLNCELRPGKQHCQSGTPEFISQSISMLKSLGLNGQALITMDSGNDAVENIDIMGDNSYIIKRNQRRESSEQWLELAKRVGDMREPRVGKKVYTGFVDHMIPGNDKSRRAVSVVFEVIERTIDANGQGLLIPEIEMNTWWTNLACKADIVIDLYHSHGTSEQFHSELKSDLDVERLPSGKMCVNKIILFCAMIAFNILRTVGQEVISRAHMVPQKINVLRWRIKTVLQNIIYCVVRLVKHAGSFELHFGKNCPWYSIISDLVAGYT